MYVFPYRSHATDILSAAISRFLVTGPIAVSSLRPGIHSRAHTAPAYAGPAPTDTVPWVRYRYVFSNRTIEQQNEEALLEDVGGLLVNITLQMEFYSRYSRADRTQDIKAGQLSIASLLHSLREEQRRIVSEGLRREVDLVESMTDEQLQEQTNYPYLPSQKQSVLSALNNWAQRLA